MKSPVTYWVGSLLLCLRVSMPVPLLVRIFLLVANVLSSRWRWVYFFGQPRGHKTNEVNHALEAKYIASALLQGSCNMASRV